MQTEDQVYAIVNPAAGGGRCGQRAPGALDALRQQGLKLVVRESEGAGHATALARAAFRAGHRKFLAVGGDGTSFELVNGVFPEGLEQGKRPSLAFLPLGTGNSFLRDFSEHGEEYARAALLEGRRRACDVVRLKHDAGELYYLNLLSLGFVADVCTVANRRFKRFGEASYGLGVVFKVAGLKPRSLPMRCDDSEFERDPTVFVSINNSRYTGGKMMMAPSADPCDGQADVISSGPMGRLALVRAFPKIFQGTHVNLPGVRTRRARHIEFELPGPTDAMVDGEVISLWPRQLDVLKGALEVFA